jgi:hypothetical protein
MTPQQITKAAEDREKERQLRPTINSVKNTGFNHKTPEYEEHIKTIKENQRNVGKAGFNEYGVPLHACNGYIQNEHYWAWIKEKNRLDPLDKRFPRVFPIRV